MIFNDPNVDIKVKLKILYALLSECCKVDADIDMDHRKYLEHKRQCSAYLWGTIVEPEVVQQYITDTATMLVYKYQIELVECIKLQDEIIQLRADYPHLNVELGTLDVADFNNPEIYTETANMLISLRECLHESLIAIGYRDLNTEYFKTKE